MITKKELTDILNNCEVESVHVRTMLENIFNRDLRPDIKVLLQINTAILGCECAVLSKHPDLKRYMELQSRFTKIFAELSKN